MFPTSLMNNFAAKILTVSLAVNFSFKIDVIQLEDKCDNHRISMTEEERNAIIRLFSQFNITLKEAWLNEALGYLHMKRPETHLPIGPLLYEQWLFTDLSCSSRPTIRLPPFAKKAKLDKDIVVQVNWFVDIHSSMYAKFREYTKRGTDNSEFTWVSDDETEDSDSADRMFLMEITDGQRKLRALEYQKISGLCAVLMPGTKLLIFGGTVCRCNILLLTAENVMVLGGESETCEKNNPAVVLARRLGINEQKLKSTSSKGKKEHVTETMKKMENVDMKCAKTPGVVSDIKEVKLGGQQNKSLNNDGTIDGKSAGAKKEKKPVLSRTITSYFQPKRKAFMDETKSVDSSKVQASLTDQEIKMEPNEQTACTVQPKQGKNSELPVTFVPPITVINSDEQSQLFASTTTFMDSKSKANDTIVVDKLKEQSGSPTTSAHTQCIQHIMTSKGEQSANQDPENVTLTQSRENVSAASQFRLRPPERILLSAKLRGENSELALAHPPAQENFPSCVKSNDVLGPVALGGKSKRTGFVAPMSSIPLWSSDLQQQSARENKEMVASETNIIPSSSVQEPATWTTPIKRQYTASTNSTQFLANAFYIPASKTQTTADGDVWMTNSASIQNSGSLKLLQKRLPATTNPVLASNDVTQSGPEQARQSVGTSVPRWSPWKHSVSSAISHQFQQKSLTYPEVEARDSQYSQVSSGSKVAVEKPQFCNAVVEDHSVTMVLPDSTLRVIPHVSILDRYHTLNITSIREACDQRRFHMVTYRKRVQPIFCKLLAGLQFFGQSWRAAIRVGDETYEALDCLVESSAITHLIGFTPQEAQQAATSKDHDRIEHYKDRARALLDAFKRLDLVLTIEFSSSSTILPLVIEITNLSTALGLC